MYQYSTAFNVRIVKAYLRGGIGHKALAIKHGVSRNRLRFWIDLYKIHGAKCFVSRHGQYSATTKLSILRRMHREKLSYTDAAAIFKLSSPEIVAKWDRLYHDGGVEALRPWRPGKSERRKAMSESKEKPPKQSDAERSREDLIAELSQLRMENASLKKLDALVRARQAPKGRK